MISGGSVEKACSEVGEFSDEKIASLIGVTVDFVKEVREGKKK